MIAHVPPLWRTLPLGEVATLQRGFDLPIQDRLPGLAPIFAANGQVGAHHVAKVAGPGVVTGRSGSIGKVHFVERDYWPLNTALYVKDFHGNHPRFIFYLLQQMRLEQYHEGTGVPTLNRNNVHSVVVPVPPLAEQRRIAAILDKGDELRAKRRAALAKLDEFTQSSFIDLFGDSGNNSKRWPLVELQEIMKDGTIITYGIVQAGDEYPGGTPYIRTGDIVDGEIVTAGLRHTDPAIASRFRRSRVEAGEIVMSIRATVGTTALVPPELDGANLTQGTARIAPGDSVHVLYLLHFLRSSGTQHWISLQIKGATFREITLTRLRELPVLMPPLSLQEEFACHVAAIEKLKAAHCASLAEMDALFASLQHRAFRGEL